MKGRVLSALTLEDIKQLRALLSDVRYVCRHPEHWGQLRRALAERRKVGLSARLARIYDRLESQKRVPSPR